MKYSEYPRPAVEDIARLRRRVKVSGLPQKVTDQNLIIGTWNLRAFGSLNPAWDDKPGAPKRNLRALATIAEVISRLDVISIQEVKSDTSGVRLLQEWLGSDWGLILSDVTAGEGGNAERLAFLYDRRRVQPSGLAGEIVLPPSPEGNPVTQFSRSPYIAGFQASGEHFALLTTHIKYGNIPADRIEEIRNLAAYVSKELRQRAQLIKNEEANLIILGDFNIDERGDNPLFQAFVSGGLQVPQALLNVPTAFSIQPKFYDQIAWFMGDLKMGFKTAGVVNFAGAVFPELTLRQMSYRISDHLPLWVEFNINHSEERMAVTLGLDPATPDPLSTVPDAPGG